MTKPTILVSDRVCIVRIEKEEGLYYLCSENKVADQLCSYCTADLRLFFAYACCWFSYVAAHICCHGLYFIFDILLNKDTRLCIL